MEASINVHSKKTVLDFYDEKSGARKMTVNLDTFYTVPVNVIVNDCSGRVFLSEKESIKMAEDILSFFRNK